MDTTSIKDALSNLSIPEITELMHDVLRSHLVHETYQSGDFYEKTHVIAQVRWGTNEGITDEAPTITLLRKVHSDVTSTDVMIAFTKRENGIIAIP